MPQRPITPAGKDDLEFVGRSCQRPKQDRLLYAAALDVVGEFSEPFRIDALAWVGFDTLMLVSGTCRICSAGARVCVDILLPFFMAHFLSRNLGVS